MSLRHAIDWQWPGARCVVRGDVITRWDGPDAQPSDAEIAHAVEAYQRAEPSITADREAAEDIDRVAMAALTWVLLRRLFPADTTTQTKAKHAALRGDVIAAFKARPWL